MVSDPQHKNWTILLLRPPGSWKINLDIDEIILTSNTHPLQIMLARLILESLGYASFGWERLARHIDELLGTGKEIFDTEAHDNLIFDDNLYTRSRRYFWVINCIDKVGNLVHANTQTYMEARDRVFRPFIDKLERDRKYHFKGLLEMYLRYCEGWTNKLESIKIQFREQRTKAVALRDGVLFIHWGLHTF